MESGNQILIYQITESGNQKVLAIQMKINLILFLNLRIYRSLEKYEIFQKINLH